MVAAEFEKLGIDASTSEITTSACVAGDYLSSKGVEGSYVYVIGEPALMSMLSERAGVRPIGGPDDAGKSKRTLQSEGHSRATEQSTPAKASSHSHAPSTQTPRPEQPPGHAVGSAANTAPAFSAAATSASGLPTQPCGHGATEEQSAPPCPSTHRQMPS